MKQAEIFQVSVKQRGKGKLKYENTIIIPPYQQGQAKQVKKITARKVEFLYLFLKILNFYSAQTGLDLFYLNFTLVFYHVSNVGQF